jgi:hypothetical protein
MGTLLVPLGDLALGGAWSCGDDGIGEHQCILEVNGASTACLSGRLAIDETFAAWGALLNRSLSDDLEPVDLNALGVIGFRIGIDGQTSGNPLRIAYISSNDSTTLPFVEVPETGVHDVLLADARIPESWGLCPDGDCLVDPTRVFGVQIQIVATIASDYDLCVTDISAIVRDDP